MKGKIALITGSARGIGKDIAHELAQQGTTVIINDISKDDSDAVMSEFLGKGLKADSYAADVSNNEQVKEMFKYIEDKYGQLDILINNAGISPKHNNFKSLIVDMDPCEWDKVIDVNLNGVFYCIHYAAPLMIKNSYGRIINMSSMAGRTYSPVPGAHYCASKAGVIGLTRVAAGELAPHNILVNAIAPGRIDTDMVREYDQEKNQEIMKLTPVGKFGSSLDVARLVIFLSSEENQFIVGATVDINGGRLML